ncbi:MAG: glycosyltransferase, partial [Congregibacter sp.]|nr:glycosyltransferase [Congregibacter sp.]
MRCLFVLGMHRSGTSLVSQALHAAGICAGPSAELLSAQSDNPEGFFENRRLVEINDELMSASGGVWYAPPTAVVADSKISNAQTALLRHLAETSPQGQFFVKDPRLCLTWPLWGALAESSSLLFVYRSPLAVARSLARRNSFPLQLGFLLWEIYNRRALASLTEDSIAVSYDQVAAGAVSLLSVLEKVQERGFDCNPAAADSVYRADLRHFDALTEDPDWRLLSESQKQLHEYCAATCLGDAPPSPNLDPEPMLLARIQDLAAAIGPLARVLETATERDEAQALSLERLQDRDRALATLTQLEREHAALAAAHAKEQELHAHAAATLTKVMLEQNELAKAHEREVSAHAALIDDHANLLNLHDRLHAEFDERGVLQRELYAANETLLSDKQELYAANETLLSDKAALQEKADYLFFVITESHRTLLLFELSTMAKTQRYTRKVYRLLTGQRGRNSAYEDLLERAHAHFDAFDLEKPRPRPSKLSMAKDILRYLRRNPAGSARSFSWPRLRRAAAVFFGSSSDDLAVWVNARFPDSRAASAAFDPDTLKPDLDQLELDFPVSDSPLVSIVVPVYNDYRVTVNCLQSVHRFSKNHGYEVIVADDCSTDLTTTISDRMRGITVSRTPQNSRFLKNCNQAAKRARGQYVVFLNNDTAVTEGWLDALLAPFADPEVGVTGPKLLFADGSLQEAGGIIWEDGSGWNFGRGDDPDRPAYSYRRDVDYVSGACLAIRSTLWKQLGGFDERFAPAYYEDADICFSARKAGYRVVYQPHSVVYHFEGVRNGTDLTAGVNQHQVVNQSVFRDKWQSELQADHFANAQHVIHARDRSANKLCVLVIDHYVPHHDKDAGGRSTYMYIQLLLALGCRVQLMGANFFPHEPYTRALQAMGVEVLVGESIARHLDDWLAEHAAYIDEVFLHRPHIAEQMLPHLERMSPRPTISFFGHDLHYLRIAREAALKDSDELWRESEAWRKRELAVCARVDRVYYFSDVEVTALADLMPAGKLRRIPLYAMQVDTLPIYAPTAPTELLFVGGYNHPPNVDAAVWLVQEILPAVRRAVPDVRLHLVGSNPPTEILALAD